MNFLDNETVLFKHYGSYNGEQGEIIVTNIKLGFSPQNKTVSVTLIPWETVDKPKYTPANDPKGRVMMMIQTVIKGPPLVFQLLGPELTACQRELERLKGIVSQIRSGMNKPAIDKPIDSTTSTTISSSNQATTTSQSNNNSVTSITPTISKGEKIRRKQLLEADQKLYLKYRDLVLQDKILTEDEFWSHLSSNHHTHMGHNNSSNTAATNMNTIIYDTTLKGKSTTLFSDIKNIKKNGKLIVNLTTEHKEHIFLMYPAVKYAYSLEVPLQKSEQEFWVSYFQSEYYNRDKGTSDGINLLTNQSRFDDILMEYELKQQQQSKDSTVNTSKIHPLINHEKKRKLDSNSIDPSVDLTATFGDYRPQELLSQLLPLEDRYIDSSGMRAESTRTSSFTDGSKPTSHYSNIVDKYNRHSTLYMQHSVSTSAESHKKKKLSTDIDKHGPTTVTDNTITTTIESTDKSTSGQDNDDSDNNQNETLLIELKKPESYENQFIPLHIHTQHGTTNTLNSTGMSTPATTTLTTTNEPVSAFGKRVNTNTNTNNQSTSLSLQVPPLVVTSSGWTPVVEETSAFGVLKRQISDDMSPSAHRPLNSSPSRPHTAVRGPLIQSTALLIDTIGSVWPNTELCQLTTRLISTQLKESALLLEASSTTSTSDSHATTGISGAINTRIQAFMTNQAIFLQEIQEIYNIITELLRHFYAMLSRYVPDQSSIEGQDIHIRIQKLLQRMVTHQETLQRKIKTVETTVTDHNTIMLCANIVSDIAKLITRAQDKWKDYQVTFGQSKTTAVELTSSSTGFVQVK